jgi:prepilin-type N-terminal cleavage/methylation domain-containing protein
VIAVMHRLRSHDQGITLVETLVAMVLLGVVGSITTAAVVASHQVLRVNSDEGQGLQDTQAVIERLGRDVRQARGVDAGATGSQLVLWIDNNSDYIRNSSTQADEIVTWSLASQGSGSEQYNTLRSTAGGTAIIQSRTMVDDIAFCYQQAPGGACLTTPLSAADAATARYVTVTVEYDALIDQGAQTRTTTFSERLRNVF